MTHPSRPTSAGHAARMLATRDNCLAITRYGAHSMSAARHVRHAYLYHLALTVAAAAFLALVITA